MRSPKLPTVTRYSGAAAIMVCALLAAASIGLDIPLHVQLIGLGLAQVLTVTAVCSWLTSCALGRSAERAAEMVQVELSEAMDAAVADAIDKAYRAGMLRQAQVPTNGNVVSLQRAEGRS